ncbi:MAG: hypothetical protein RL681_509 [Candidatus Parcubacteria bacterium]|jgi:adenylate kinase
MNFHNTRVSRYNACVKYNVVFMVGPQGSGKGTQAKALAEKLGFFHWEMSAMIREEKDMKFADGRTVGDVINAGTLLNDDQIIEIFHKRIPAYPKDAGIIFDGVPRRLGQAQFIMDYLKKQGRTSFVTIFLDIPREESIKRLMLRAAIEHRVDDTPERIDYRLKQYQEATVPMLDYLRTCTVFLDVDGSPSIPEVTKTIMEALEIAYQT